MNVAVKTRSDKDNLAVLDRLRPLHSTLRADLIRAESEVQRLERELAEAKAAAEAEAGTSDLNALRQMVQDIRAENTAAIDEFDRTLQAVKSGLDAIPKA